MPRKITIEPVTRVEGHGKVTIFQDDDGNITQTRLHIVEFRGFEKFIVGRPYWEAPVVVQRLAVDSSDPSLQPVFLSHEWKSPTHTLSERIS